MNRKQLNVSRVQRIKRLLLPLVLGLIGALNSWAESKLYFIHSDHLGTPQVVTDENQTVVWKAEYTPFGEATVDEDPDNDGTDVNLNLRFPGQYFDEESGLNYNYFRDYDPSLGRYVQSDPIGILRDYSNPQMQVAMQMGIPLQSGINDIGLNHLYGYAEQNPIINFDPFGLRCWRDSFGQTVCDSGSPYPAGHCPGGDCAAYPSSTNNQCVQDCIAKKIEVCKTYPAKVKDIRTDAVLTTTCGIAVVMSCSGKAADCKQDGCNN